MSSTLADQNAEAAENQNEEELILKGRELNGREIYYTNKFFSKREREFQEIDSSANKHIMDK